MTRPPRGWPAWAGRRRLAFWGTFAALVAAAIVWRAGNVREAVGESVHRTHALMIPGLALQAATWGRTRAALAETIAALLAPDIASAEGAGVPPRDAAVARFASAMEVLGRREGFVTGRVLDAAGAVITEVHLPGAHDRAAGRRDDVGAPRPDDATGPRRAPAERPDRAPTPRVRTTAVRCGPAFCAEFHAPILVGTRRVGTVVLVAPVGDSTFAPLNASRADIRTLRTTVLAPLGIASESVALSPATLAVVASVGAPASPEPSPILRLAELPPHVRRALAAPPGRLAVDTGSGLHGALTHYGVVRVQELDWIVLREIDRSEVMRSARIALLVEEPILVALLVSVVALARNRLRARRGRREAELSRLRADFVAGTSHELRTPLAQIRMFAELLQKGALRDPEDRARALRIIEKEASRLTILVDNLLNYSRLRRRAENAVELAAIPALHLTDEVTQVIEAFAPLAAERGAHVVSRVPRGLHARVDSLALRQVLNNFLENAVKYGREGQTVTIGASADGQRVRLWVDDEGPGVPAEERTLIWEAFRRGNVAEASSKGGSGIGLAVVRELVLHYGGAVAVEDAPGAGARFVAEFARASGVTS